MRISDWSSDVCSSDLNIEDVSARVAQQARSFTGLVASAGQVNDSNRRIATAAGDAREKAAQTAGSVRASEETVRNAVDDIHALVEASSEERRVGKECVSPCRSRWAPSP